MFRRQTIQLVFGPYAFTLKKFKYVESLSDETNCYVADLYVNGIRLASCRNDGRGGKTDIQPEHEQYRLYHDVKAFLKTQPKIRVEEYDFEFDCDLEYIADELAYREILTIQERKSRKHKKR